MAKEQLPVPLPTYLPTYLPTTNRQSTARAVCSIKHIYQTESSAKLQCLFPIGAASKPSTPSVTGARPFLYTTPFAASHRQQRSSTSSFSGHRPHLPHSLRLASYYNVDVDTASHFLLLLLVKSLYYHRLLSFPPDLVLLYPSSVHALEKEEECIEQGLTIGDAGNMGFD